MLEIIINYINNLPDEDFNSYYQEYILNTQDDNIGLEINQSTFNDINKLLLRIQQELGTHK